jgi:hypothetical protein
VPPRTVLRRVLDELHMDELRGIADHVGVPRARSQQELVRRLAIRLRNHRDPLTVIVDDGPLAREDWNDVVERCHGQRRRSFEEIRQELTDAIEFGEFRELTVSTIRNDDDLLDALAARLGARRERVAGSLEDIHGNQLFGNVLSVLRQALRSPLESSTGSSAKGTTRVSDLGNPGTGMRPRRGDVLCDRWEVRRLLGQGGFGLALEVLDRRHPEAPPFVAKLPHIQDSEVARREFRKARQLNHPHICRYILDHEDDRWGFFVLIEHGGVSLGEMFEGEPAAPREAIRLVTEAAEGLDFLHGRSIVHGDVSPGNVLVGDDGVARLTHIGLAATQRTVRATRGLTKMATAWHGYHLLYSAPEVRAGGFARRSSDQFSLALVFCAILRGVAVFRGDASECDRLLSRGQRTAVRKALAAGTADRFETCGAFVQALRR